MPETLRQEKILAARLRYEAVMAQHPALRNLEEQLIDVYRQKVAGEGLSPAALSEAVEVLNNQRLVYLKKNGIEPDFAEPRWDCPLCQDTGLYEGRACSCEERRILETLFRGAHLPIRLREQTFQKFSLDWYSPTKRTPLGDTERERAATVLNACKSFVAQVIEGQAEVAGLFLTGPSGLGKTFLCSSICHALAENNIVSLYIVFSDLISDMRASFQQSSGDTDLLAMARQTPVLILDDLGAEHVTEYAVSRLFDIINFRRNERLPLVISSNLSLNDIERVYGTRLASRVLEACHPLPLYGTDIRLQQRKLGIH